MKFPRKTLTYHDFHNLQQYFELSTFPDISIFIGMHSSHCYVELQPDKESQAFVSTTYEHSWTSVRLAKNFWKNVVSILLSIGRFTINSETMAGTGPLFSLYQYNYFQSNPIIAIHHLHLVALVSQNYWKFCLLRQILGPKLI